MSVLVLDQIGGPAPSTDQLVKRDRYGRYLIPDPRTGQTRPWTRATTLASTLADHYGLEQWAKRNVVLGIGARRDLYTAAVACTADDKKALNDIVRQAEAAAKASAGANQGTALHRLTERSDAGETLTIPDPALAADVDAYRRTMAATGIRVARDADTSRPWIERVLVAPDLDAAGTCDRICLADTWPQPRVSDLKTGKDVITYGMTEIALQLAIYAAATHWYDPATGDLHPMPVVDRERALVMHLPVGQATCTLIEVDIAAGLEAVHLATAVRAWRKRKDLAQIVTSPVDSQPGPTLSDGGPIESTGSGWPAATGVQGSALHSAPESKPELLLATRASSPAPPAVRPAVEAPGEAGGGGTPRGSSPSAPAAPAATPLTERTAWLRNRVARIIDTGHETDLAARWPAGCPTLRQGGLTFDQVTAVAAACDEVEMLFELPFGPPDPAYIPPSDGVEHISGPLAQAVEQMAAASPPPQIDNERYAAAGRAVLEQFDSENEQRAVADCAQADGLMTAAKLDRLTAVAEQVADPIGAIWFNYGAATCRIVPSDNAIAAMVAGATEGDPRYATTGKGHALTRAKRLAKALELPAPRSLAQAAETPLLAALVAAGRGAADTDNNTNTETQ